jgi:hypothetical protein
MQTARHRRGISEGCTASLVLSCWRASLNSIVRPWQLSFHKAQLSSWQSISEKFVPRADCSLAHFISGQLATVKLHLQQHAESFMLICRDQPEQICGDINTR